MRKAVAIALLMSLVMTLVSAFIRLSDNALGCDDWPSCFITNVRVDAQPGIVIQKEDSHTGLRVLHRVTASIFGIVALILFVVTFWFRKSQPLGLLESTLVFCLTMVLALVGLNTPNITNPMITFINISGGMLLTAILFFWMRKIENRGLQYWSGQRLLLMASLSTYVAIMSGAWMSSNYAATACDTLFSCLKSSESSILEAFSFNRELSIVDGNIILDGNETLISRVHHILAILSFVVIGYLGYVKYSVAPLRVMVLITLTLVMSIQGTLGLVIINQYLASAHNAMSIFLMITILSLVERENFHV